MKLELERPQVRELVAAYEHLIDILMAEMDVLMGGRDIKGLAKLVAKYCHRKQVSASLAVFQRCAVFRGMEQRRQPAAPLPEQLSHTVRTEAQ